MSKRTSDSVAFQAGMSASNRPTKDRLLAYLRLSVIVLFCFLGVLFGFHQSILAGQNQFQFASEFNDYFLLSQESVTQGESSDNRSQAGGHRLLYDGPLQEQKGFKHKILPPLPPGFVLEDKEGKVIEIDPCRVTWDDEPK